MRLRNKSPLVYNRTVGELLSKNISTVFVSVESKSATAWLRRAILLNRSQLVLVTSYSRFKGKSQKWLHDIEADFKIKSEDLSDAFMGESEFYDLIRESSIIIHQAVNLCEKIFGSSKLVRKKK